MKEIASHSDTYKSAHVHTPRNKSHPPSSASPPKTYWWICLRYWIHCWDIQLAPRGRRRVSSELLCCRASVRYRLQLNITLDNSSRVRRAFASVIDSISWGLNSWNFWDCVGDVHVLHRGGLVGGKVNKIWPCRQSCCQNYLAGQTF